MNKKKTYYRALVSKLQNVLNSDKYLSHKAYHQLIDEIADDLPHGLLEYLVLAFHPIRLIATIRVKKFISAAEEKREAHNQSFITTEVDRLDSFFGNIESRSLDSQQRQAVVTDEDNCLVVAGAGSGKTLTIVAKIKYLTEQLSVDPKTILPISFTRKSALSMRERVKNKAITPHTFHKFGLTVIESVERRRPSIFDDSKSDKLLRSFLDELQGQSIYLEKLNDFFVHYFKIQVSEFSFNSLGEYIQYLKDQNFNTYKKIKIPYKGRETYRNETVKSIQECIIANFLLFNRVDYEYEASYEHSLPMNGRKKARYNPDFTIKFGKKIVYLEHFGIDRDFNVPAFFAGPNETYEHARQKYLSGIEWKRKVHNDNHTAMIETYSYEFSEGTLLQDLEIKLKEVGVPLDPMSPAEVWQTIKESGKDEVDAFISMVQTFLTLLKSSNVEIQDVETKNRDIDDDFMRKRGELFLQLFEPIFKMYEDYLHTNGQIDFSDMISKATEYIENKDFICKLNYVIIDEFQDLSVGRYKILQAIRSQNPNVKFYCVGDDWQSIYRFTGSDIALFRDFDRYFGFTEKLLIETTHRFNDPLITMSSEFILKNDNQSRKTLNAPQGANPTTYSVVESEGQDDTSSLCNALQMFIDEGMNPKDSILLLGRYNFDLKRIENKEKQFHINFNDGIISFPIKEGKYKGRKLTVEFLTAHRAKGLEADFVVVINCNSGKYGFPSGKADDPILNLLLSSADQFENGEERRLFYVAMTRAKRHVVFVTDRYHKSKFIRELERETGVLSPSKICPVCKEGELVLRFGRAPGGRKFPFYGCTNFMYGCDYTEKYVESQEEKQAKAEVIRQKEIIKLEQKISSTPVPEGLTRSQLNKILYFISKPESYAHSAQGRAKVDSLERLRPSMPMELLQKYIEAYDVWEAALTPTYWR